MPRTMPIEWKLKTLLEQHELSAYRVAKQANIGLTTIYRFTNNQVQTFSGHTIDDILQAIYELTGKRYGIGDIVEWKPKDGDSSHA